MAQLIQWGKLTASQAGTINMAYFLAYGMGQILNGFLGDRLKAKHMIFCGLFCSGIINGAMIFASNYFLMALFWFFNGIFQSMIWPPLIRTLSERLPEGERQKAGVNIVSSMVSGTLFSYLLSAFFLKFANWSFSFGFAAIDLIAISLLWLILYPTCIENKGCIGRTSLQESVDKATSLSLFDLFFKRGLFLLLIPVIIHGTIKDGVTSWIPTFISERFGLSPSLSLIITLIIPVINLASAYWAQHLFKLLKSETKAASVFFLTSALSLILLQTLGKQGALISGIFLAIVTASMMAVNVLFVNLIPMHFEKDNKVSTVSGLLNALAYFGSAFASLSIGFISERWGWDTTVFTWITGTLVGLGVCLLIRNLSFERK